MASSTKGRFEFPRLNKKQLDFYDLKYEEISQVSLVNGYCDYRGMVEVLQ